MPAEDEVTYKAIFLGDTSPSFGAVPVVFGSELARLLSINYVLESPTDSTTMWVAVGLSRNPEHEFNPPGDVESFQSDPSIYGRQTWAHENALNGINWGVSNMATGRQVHLHGMLIPKRQILVYGVLAGSKVLRVSGEIYYIPIRASRAARASVDMPFGKYRRNV